MEVADAPLGPAVEVAGEASLRDVARAMQTRDVSAVIVRTRSGTGIIAERDLVRAMAEGMDGSAPAERLATPGPVGVRTSTGILDALVLMLRHDVRQVPVIDDRGIPIGLLSLRTALEMLLRTVDQPSWLGAFRIALRLEPHGR